MLSFSPPRNQLSLSTETLEGFYYFYLFVDETMIDRQDTQGNNIDRQQDEQMAFYTTVVILGWELMLEGF